LEFLFVHISDKANPVRLFPKLWKFEGRLEFQNLLHNYLSIPLNKKECRSAISNENSKDLNFEYLTNGTL